MRKTVSGVYHVKCFVCSVCKRQLETGEQMYLVQVRRRGRCVDRCMDVGASRSLGS